MNITLSKTNGLISDAEFEVINTYQDGSGMTRESVRDGILYITFNTTTTQEQIDSLCTEYNLEQIL